MIAALFSAGSALATVGLWFTRHRFTLLLLLAGLVLFQNPVTMIALRTGVVPIHQGEAFLIAKEVVALIGIVLASGAVFARSLRTGMIRLGRTERLSLIYFAIVGFAFVTSDAVSLTANLAGVRSLVILPALFLLGLWLGAKEDDVRNMQRLLVIIAAALAVFGLVEAYLLPDSFWLAIGHEEYYLMKRGRPIQGILYGNMRFWIDGTPVRRIASITGDPLISSYLIAFGIWILASYAILRRRVRLSMVVLATVLVGALLLTFSRGAFVTLGVAAALIVLRGRRSLTPVWITALGFLSAILVAMTLGDQILQVTTGAGHLNQIRQGIQSALTAPLGHGTGTAGAVAASYVLAAGGDGAIAADSFIGSLLIQVGLPGLVLFVAVMLSMVHELYRYALRSSRSTLRWWHVAAATFLSGLFVVSTVNEAGYGFAAAGLVFIWAGMLVGIERDSHTVERVGLPSKMGQPTPVGSMLEPHGLAQG